MGEVGAFFAGAFLAAFRRAGAFFFAAFLLVAMLYSTFPKKFKWNPLRPVQACSKRLNSCVSSCMRMYKS
jgi:hypothetical protein